MKELYAKNRDEWRQWLATNHDKSVGVRLVFYKKHSSTPSLQYDEAVEEALCVGWINVAKGQETKERRVDESIALLQQGKRLGLK